jgi:hypothetical protein
MTSLTTEPASRVQAVGLGTWLWFLVGLAILVAGLLIGPRIADDQQAAHCVVNIHLPGPFGIGLNCDSPEFLRLAESPSGLLEPMNKRQSRPGLILAAALLALPLRPLVNIPNLLQVNSSRPDIEPGRIGNALATQFPQIFNTLIPVLGVYAFARTFDGGVLDRRFMVMIGLAMGFGLTAYPTFLAIIPCTVLACLLAAWQKNALAAQALANTVIYLALSIAPVVLWYVFVQWKTGTFYSEELSSVSGPYHWIPEVFAKGGVFGLLMFVLNAFWLCVALAARMTVSVLLIAAVIAVVAWRHPAEAVTALRRNGRLLFAALVVELAIAGFYALSGDVWQRRWSAALIPPLLIAASAILLSLYSDLRPAGRRRLATACGAAAAFQIVFTIAKDGPFS